MKKTTQTTKTPAQTTKKNEKKPRFRIRGKSIFLTYAKSDTLTKKYISEMLMLFCEKKNLSGIAVCAELHKDGTKHHHAMLDFSKEFETENVRFFDIDTCHPKVESIRNRERALGYLLKEDKDVLMDDHMEKLTMFWDSTARYQVERMLKKGYGPDYTAMQLSNYGYKNTVKIRNWWKVLQAGKIREKELRKTGWHAVLEKCKSLPSEIYECLSIAAECEKAGKTRPLKTLNLLLWSKEPSYGKTTFTQALSKFLRTFDFPTDGWWDGYDDCFYQVIVWNECSFVGWQIQQINKLFEGSGIQLPIKGAKQTKTDNPLIVCTSNLNLEGLLKQKGYDDEKISFYLPILRTRIREVRVTKDMLWPVLANMETEMLDNMEKAK